MTTAATGDLLGTIVAATRRIVAVRQEARPLSSLTAARRPRGDAFASALRSSQAPRVIAECKRRSPSKGVLREHYDAAAHAKSYAEAGAAAISVLTEPTFFDGSLEHLDAVRQAVSVPLLRKDFIVSTYQLVEAVGAGADAVLLIVGALSDVDLHDLLAQARTLGLAAVVEVHDEAELDRALAGGATIVGVNSRNLRTLAVDLTVLDRIAAVLPRHVIAVAESGIRTSADLSRLSDAGYHAFLVGERLMTRPDPGAALRELRGQ
jgi:indole-3-glycerol phosphate synthase